MDPSAGPGDVRPRHLERPPGERYDTAPPRIRDRPDLARGLLLGAGAGAGVAVAAALLRSILDVTTGLLAVAVAGGWLVGVAVRHGAWGGDPHRASAAPEVMGAALGAGAWIVGLVLAWVVALAILPGSERSLPDRLSAMPFLDWLGPQVGLADLLSLILAAASGWLGARSVAAAGPPVR